MTDKAAAPERLRCSRAHCTVTVVATVLADDMPLRTRARTAGWRVWSGATRGGTPIEEAWCPRHWDEDDQTAAEWLEQQPVWGAACDTCYERESKVLKEAAEVWMEEHVCEPRVELIAPAPVAVERAAAAR